MVNFQREMEGRLLAIRSMPASAFGGPLRTFVDTRTSRTYPQRSRVGAFLFGIGSGMQRCKSSGPVLRASILVIASLVAAGGTTSFFVFGFAGLAAWSDYNSRGCPEAVQCSDAEAVIWGAAFVSPISLIVAVVAVWLTIRTLRRRESLSD